MTAMNADINEVVWVTSAYLLAYAVPLLFTGDHLFELRAEAGGTRLFHSETLSGLIPWRITDEQIETAFVPAYEACNRALAVRLNSLENVFPLRLGRTA